MTRMVFRLRPGRLHRLACAMLIMLLVCCATILPQAMAQVPTDLLAPAETEAPAESPAQPVGAVEVGQEAARLEAAENELGRIRRSIDENRANDLVLTNLRLELQQLATRMVDLGLRVSPRLNEIRSRLEQLGDAPAEGQPAEPPVIASERERLSEERAQINALVGSAEDISIDANREADRITEIRRQLFTETLISRTPVDLTLFSNARAEFAVEMLEFRRMVSSWAGFVWSSMRGAVLAVLALSLTAALLFLYLARYFSRLVTRDPARQSPSYFARLSVAFWSIVAPSVATAAFVATTYALMNGFGLLRTDMVPIVQLSMAIVVVLVFIWQLSFAVLAPAQPAWRLVNVSNSGARKLILYVLAISVVSSLDYFFSGISVVLGSDVVLTVAKSFIASVIIGFLLIGLSFTRPTGREAVLAEDEGTATSAITSTERGDWRWAPYVAIPLRLAGIAMILLSLAGYVGLARFISNQIIITGAALVTMYIGFLSGRSITGMDNFGETAVGRFLARRLRFGPVALDQAALVSALAIYALVLALGVPMILLQWGFQLPDIQSWALRLFTEIRVGNISISLLGIFFGLLVFILGLLVTKWFQRWLDGSVMERGRVDLGVRNSIRTAIGYAGVAIAGIIGVSAAGIDLSSLALVAGALSLGIGFGLQNIVSNFVSGLILLAERPFKVGDWVVTGTTEGFVKRISVRATEIETFQRQSIIVPNSELINASVGNWTHRNVLGRVEVAVGVSYDADPRKVMAILYEIAQDHPLIMRNPEPAVFFVSFGDSSLDFELRVFLNDVLNGMSVRTDLRLAIFERFKSEGIDIPYPQRDLNIKIEADDPETARRERDRMREDPVHTARTLSRHAAETLDDGAVPADGEGVGR